MVLCLLVFVASSVVAVATATQSVSVDFNNVTFVSKTVLSLQVVANPLLDPRTCNLAKPAWNLLKELTSLGARQVRYVPWFPFPKFSVAELNPPSYRHKKSFWNFHDISPQLDEFINSTEAPVINFSTQPAWFYNGSWSYPKNPLQIDWDYSDGDIAYSNTTSHLAGYYGRLLSWLVKGHFVDEFGHHHYGGPAMGQKLTHWEIFNEIEGEHAIPPQTYNDEYDAITAAIRREADPQHHIKFVGLALESAYSTDYIETFLNASNHAPGTPLDFLSFHFYSLADSRTNATSWEDMILPQVDTEMKQVAALVAMRDSLNPDVKLSLDELGTILPDDNDNNASEPTPLYFQASGAQFAYAFVELAALKIDIVGMSELAGFPVLPQCQIVDAQYPSVSMFDWNTGKGNNRANVLKLLLQNFAVGTKFAATTSTHGPAIARGFISANDGKHKVMLINSKNAHSAVNVNKKTVQLQPFDVKVVEY